MMAILMTALHNWKIEGTDGDVGSIVDVLFDERSWQARYLAVETGGWLGSRRVLLSPASVHRVAGEIGKLHVDVTREQVRQAPELNADLPSPQAELAHAQHYGYRHDWAGVPAGAPEGAGGAAAEALSAQTALRSGSALVGSRLEAADGDAGDVDDLELDIETWRIRGVIVDTRRWWPGGRVVLEPAAMAAVGQGAQTVATRLTREQVKSAPKPG